MVAINLTDASSYYTHPDEDMLKQHMGKTNVSLDFLRDTSIDTSVRPRTNGKKKCVVIPHIPSIPAELFQRLFQGMYLLNKHASSTSVSVCRLISHAVSRIRTTERSTTEEERRRGEEEEWRVAEEERRAAEEERHREEEELRAAEEERRRGEEEDWRGAEEERHREEEEEGGELRRS